jgi:hypothetical protein
VVSATRPESSQYQVTIWRCSCGLVFDTRVGADRHHEAIALPERTTHVVVRDGTG